MEKQLAEIGRPVGTANTPNRENPLDRRAVEADQSLVIEELRDRVERELRAVGFVWRNTSLELPDADSKEAARLFHSQQRRQVLEKSAQLVSDWEDRLIPLFADGSEIDPGQIKPRVEAVETDEQAALFRYATLSWSVPVSQGYGRRTRFLLWDDHAGKLMGIFAMGDPVFNLRVRDSLIGWDTTARENRLYNVFDAYVLGAVEPYRQLLGGKMAALATISDNTIDYLADKYRGTKTTWRKEEKPPRPVLVTTTSALGRSSIYNRLRFADRRVFFSVGFTEGFGHFQFSEQLFNDLVRFMRQMERDKPLRGNKYGQGPNWKIRTLRSGLEVLGLPGDLLKHGLKREVFLAPLGVAWRAFLRGETDSVQWYNFQLDELAAHFRERWAVPRAERRPEYASFKRDEIRVSRELEGD